MLREIPYGSESSTASSTNDLLSYVDLRRPTHLWIDHMWTSLPLEGGFIESGEGVDRTRPTS